MPVTASGGQACHAFQCVAARSPNRARWQRRRPLFTRLAERRPSYRELNRITISRRHFHRHQLTDTGPTVWGELRRRGNERLVRRIAPATARRKSARPRSPVPRGCTAVREGRRDSTSRFAITSRRWNMTYG